MNVIELVPNNTKRIEVTVMSPNAAGTLTPAQNLTLTVRVAASPTATDAVSASLSYVAAPYTTPGAYFVDILGPDITGAVLAGDLQPDVLYAIQVLEGDVLRGYHLSIVRLVRNL